MAKSKIFLNSSIYSLLNLLQKGINFLLVPVLTVYLTTYDYGVVAVVTAINAFLNVFYLLSLNASVNRYYYEYQGDRKKVKELFGTVITFVFGFSVCLSIILGFGHKYFIDPFLDNVDFFPFMFLGMISVLFNPIFTIYQNTLQAQQKGKQYGKNNIAFFLFNITFLLIGVVVLNLGAKGVLGALAVTNIIFFLVTISKFGKEFTFGINRKILKESLKYSLPLVPHSISGVATNIIDRLFINNFLSTSAAGIYNLGSTFGGIIFLIASGVNQAFVPWFNQLVKANSYKQIPNAARLLVVFYCVMALGISFFGKDIIFMITPSVYHEAWKVIPFISFAFVFHSVYYFFSVPLFYDLKRNGSRVLPIFTVSAALLNITLNYFLIIKFGIIGAAVATLITKFVLVFSLSRIYKRFVAIEYANKLMLYLPWCYFIVSLIVFYEFERFTLFIKIITFLVILFFSFSYVKNDFIQMKNNNSEVN